MNLKTPARIAVLTLESLEDTLEYLPNSEKIKEILRETIIKIQILTR